jgi:hypothetical protein
VFTFFGGVCDTTTCSSIPSARSSGNHANSRACPAGTSSYSRLKLSPLVTPGNIAGSIEITPQDVTQGETAKGGSPQIIGKNTLSERKEGWRRGWDSNSRPFLPINNLRIPRCRSCRHCQQCRGALPGIARVNSTAAVSPRSAGGLPQLCV